MTAGQRGQRTEAWHAGSYLIGHPLEQQDRYHEALAIYEDAIERDPDDTLAYLLAGGALENLDRDDDARACYERALVLAEQAMRQDGGECRAHVHYADALWKLDRVDEALDAYDRAIRIAPDDPLAYVNKGWALFVLSELVAARELFEHAHQLRPDDADILNRLSNVAWDLWDYPEALRLVEQAIALDPTQPRFYSGLATTLSYLGRAQEAQEAEARYYEMLRGNG